MILELKSILQPKYLNSEYKRKLLQSYKGDYEKSSNENGYIVKINNIIDIVSSHINNNNDIIIVSKCNCSIFKPIPNMEVNCKIDLIHVNGLFMSKYDIKIMVPKSDEYIFKSDHILINNKKYIVGNNLDIIIIDVRYYKNIYSCIGKLILKEN